MRPVRREELQDWMTWSETRAASLEPLLAIKRRRRVHVGEHLTLLFENRDTIRYQIQEMMRTERLVKEADIRHELDTYNELLGRDGELGCTLLVEIEDPVERDRELERWTALPDHLYLALEDGRRVRPGVDERQRGRRLSSVQFLKFDVQGHVPVAAGCDLAELSAETRLTPDQRAALREDLSA